MRLVERIAGQALQLRRERGVRVADRVLQLVVGGGTVGHRSRAERREGKVLERIFLFRRILERTFFSSMTVFPRMPAAPPGAAPRAASPRRARLLPAADARRLRPAGDDAALARPGRPLSVPRARGDDLDAVRARLQPDARHHRPAVVRPRRLLRRRRLRLRPAAAAGPRQPLVRPRRRGARHRGARGGGGGLHRPQARHLLRAADDRLRPGVLVRRGQVAQRHRRRGRPAQHRPAGGELRLSPASTCAATRRCSISASASSRSSSSPSGGW